MSLAAAVTLRLSRGARSASPEREMSAGCGAEIRWRWTLKNVDGGVD